MKGVGTLAVALLGLFELYQTCLGALFIKEQSCSSEGKHGISQTLLAVGVPAVKHQRQVVLLVVRLVAN